MLGLRSLPQINIIMINKISFIVFCLLLITSCGSDDSFEEAIIGTWTGNLTQVDCCTYDVEITISSLTLTRTSQRGATLIVVPRSVMTIYSSVMISAIIP